MKIVVEYDPFTEAGCATRTRDALRMLDLDAEMRQVRATRSAAGEALGVEDRERRTLVYLISVAQKTPGSEVWRALFAQMLEGRKVHGEKEISG